jgi:MOSC domain-containing protein YiiM/GNAT superfamily N-acetyltransferase
MTEGPAAAGGRVHQVNVSAGGVPKLPVESARITKLGLEGDRQAHVNVHGGPHRAVALLALEAIDRVRADGHPIAPGAVGENLTTTGIELSLLPVGTRLAIGDALVLELSNPAYPCDVIKGAFRDGKSGRISILTHPTDSRMYARVLAEGEVRRGDPIRVLPPSPDSQAATHALLDLVESVERDDWLALWQAAAAAGHDVRILDAGDLVAAASPELPGSIFNRVMGVRLVPAVLPRAVELFRAAGVTAWIQAETPPLPGVVAEEVVGVHAAAIGDPPRADVPGLTIREIGPGESATWAEAFVAGFGLEDPLATAWRRLAPELARSRGQHQFLAEIEGRVVGAAASFVRRRVAWLGGGTVLPEARGRGIQRALIAERIARATDAGARWAMATADADTISAGNLEAMGLPRIWTRTSWRLDRPT